MSDLPNLIRTIRDLSREEKLALRTVLENDLRATPSGINGNEPRSGLLGLFADEPDVMDRVMESVYENRARSLRAE